MTHLRRSKKDYREEVQRLAAWCSVNNFILNNTKTKETIRDFRKSSAAPQPHLINGDCVESVSDFRFLGTHITEDLSWTMNHSSQEGQAATLLSEDPQEEQHGGEAAGVLLLLLHPECAGVLYNHMVY